MKLRIQKVMTKKTIDPSTKKDQPGNFHVQKDRHRLKFGSF